MKEIKGTVVLVLILIQVLFGLNFPASKIIVSEIDPFLWANIRFLLAGVGMVFLSLLLRRKHPPVTKKYLISLFPLSLLGMCLGQGLFLYGLKLTSSVNSAILVTTIPILTLIIVVIRKQEILTYNKILGILIAFMGVVLIRDISQMSMGNQTIIGDLLVVIGSLCFALYLSYGKKFFQEYDHMWSTAWMLLISGLFMLLFNIQKIPVLFDIEYTDKIIGSSLYSIIGATLITYLLNNWALKKASSGMVAIFIYLQPIVAGVVAYFYLGEEITVRMLICSLFILAGVMLTTKSQKSFKGKS